MLSISTNLIQMKLYFSSGSDSGDSEGDDADGLKGLLALGNNSKKGI